MSGKLTVYEFFQARVIKVTALQRLPSNEIPGCVAIGRELRLSDTVYLVKNALLGHGALLLVGRVERSQRETVEVREVLDDVIDPQLVPAYHWKREPGRYEKYPLTSPRGVIFLNPLNCHYSIP